MMNANDLTGIFRSNPKYEFVPHPNLTPSEQEVLADVFQDKDLIGILRPEIDCGLTIRVINQNVENLFQTLREPGKISPDILSPFGESAASLLEKLVLDGVLELEVGKDFISGPRAYYVLYPDKQEPQNIGRISRLSIKALQYGQMLDIQDPRRLALKLYSYNRHPLTPELIRQFPTPDHVERYLGIDETGKNRHLLERYWERASISGEFGAIWTSWKSRDKDRDRRCTYKLYFSTPMKVLVEVFGDVLQVLSRSRATDLKFGKTIAQLTRPDNFMAYFPTMEDLRSGAENLASALKGIPTQGVPFTAEITEGGLLSWGIDPPKDKYKPLWQEKESWRVWVTNRLASALIAAKNHPDCDRQFWQFALDRLALEGVDTQNWIPSESIWTTNE